MPTLARRPAVVAARVRTAVAISSAASAALRVRSVAMRWRASSTKLTAGRPPVSEKRKDITRKRDSRGHRGENKQERTLAATGPDSRRRLKPRFWPAPAAAWVPDVDDAQAPRLAIGAPCAPGLRVRPSQKNSRVGSKNASHPARAPFPALRGAVQPHNRHTHRLTLRMERAARATEGSGSGNDE